MIENERQYEITKMWAARFKKAMEEDRPLSPDVHPLLVEAEKAAIKHQYLELKDQIEQYDAQRNDKV
jgi:hypothetical protein